MKIHRFNKINTEWRRAKLPILLSMTLFLLSCATADTQHASMGRVAASDVEPRSQTDSPVHADDSDSVAKESDSSNELIAEVAGAVITTVATVWVVAEFIEEKVVPAVIGLTVAYLLYQASRDSERIDQHQPTETF